MVSAPLDGGGGGWRVPERVDHVERRLREFVAYVARFDVGECRVGESSERS